MVDQDYMRQAIEICLQGIEAGQSPFGAIVVKDGHVVARAHNTVWADTDPTAHAEVNVIRRAALALQTIALHGCTLYTTCEPCPMCLSAIHWSKIDRVVFGASIADASRSGFSELSIPAQRMVEMGRSPLIVEGGTLREECARLFDEWKSRGMARVY